MVVYGVEGLDEISIAGETMVGELKTGRCASTSSTRASLACRVPICLPSGYPRPPSRGIC